MICVDLRYLEDNTTATPLELSRKLHIVDNQSFEGMAYQIQERG